jgi:hypothetical protein
MRKAEIQAAAAEALDFFIQAMPDVPFTADDIIIDVISKSGLVKHALKLCEICAPGKIISEKNIAGLSDISMNAVRGKKKSAVLISLDANRNSTPQKIHAAMIHELMHIFTALTEMRGETHFYDIWGIGTTPKYNPTDPNWQYRFDGYFVWTEFIAQYYALRLTQCRGTTLSSNRYRVNEFICDLKSDDRSYIRESIPWICAYYLSSEDAGENLPQPKVKLEVSSQTWECLSDCLVYLFEHMQNDKPWEITEAFIIGLGEKLALLLPRKAELNTLKLLNAFLSGMNESTD